MLRQFFFSAPALLRRFPSLLSSFLRAVHGVGAIFGVDEVTEAIDGGRARWGDEYVTAVVEKMEYFEKKALFTLSSWYLILQYRLEVMAPIEMPIMFFYHTALLSSLRKLAEEVDKCRSCECIIMRLWR